MRLTLAVMLATVFLTASTANSAEISEDAKSYFAGLGIAVSFCSGCHDVGPLGPRDQFSRAPRFENVMDRFDADSATRVADIEVFLTEMKEAKRRNQRMPPLGLNEEEIKWLATYLADADF